MPRNVLVTGAGGFIGGHLVKRLLEDEDVRVHAADNKHPMDWFQLHEGTADHQVDLRNYDSVRELIEYVDPAEIYHLAADMGGMGFISKNNADILRNNLAIDLNMLKMAAATHRFYAEPKLETFFYASSVCVYPEDIQMDGEFVRDVREEDAYPANPQDAYGWEKLTMERLLLEHYYDYGFPIRIARFHNCYGPYCAWNDGREKAPAALCRKVAEAKHFQDPPYEIEVWGDGKQIRPFVYVDDLIDGIMRLVRDTSCPTPVNIGPTWSAEFVKEDDEYSIITINNLVYRIAIVAGLSPEDYQIKHVTGPEGVRYRGADGTAMFSLTSWRPTTPLQRGISKLYEWIEQQVLEEAHNATEVS